MTAGPPGAATPGQRNHQAETIAIAFHDAYEELAPEYGYRTREASAKPWDEIPANNAGLMVATVERLLERGVIAAAAPAATPDPRLAIALNALQRIDRTRRTVVDQAALWDIAQEAIDKITEIDLAAPAAPQDARADEFARVKVKLCQLIVSLDETTKRGGASAEEFDQGAGHASAVTARQLRAILDETAVSAGLGELA